MCDDELDDLIAELDSALDDIPSTTRKEPYSSFTLPPPKGRQGTQQSTTYASSNNSRARLPLHNNAIERARSDFSSLSSNAQPLPVPTDSGQRRSSLKHSLSSAFGQSTSASSFSAARSLLEAPPLEMPPLIPSAAMVLPSASRTKQPVKKQPTFSSDSDYLNDLISDLDGALSKEISTSMDADRMRRSSLTNLTVDYKRKCYPPMGYAGQAGSRRGSNALQGRCDTLHCLSCDHPVLQISGHSWRPDVVNYMFFRNFMPDMQKLSAGLLMDPLDDTRAYACQCSWLTLHGTTAVDMSTLNDQNWICGGHS